jgi:ribose transport system permease protein
MGRLLGVFLMVAVLYAVLMGSFENTFTRDNHQELARRLGFYGVLTLGVGIVIVAGGIDLSIGSLVGLAAISYGLLLVDWKLSPLAAAAVVVAGGAAVGLFHGLLITKLQLQPFLVTLCGLFMYRGLARRATGGEVNLPENPATEAMRTALVSGQTMGVSNALWLLLLLAAVLAVLLHQSVYGRYWYAIGHNEQAARYAGIATDRYKVAAYVLCSMLAGLGGVLLLLDNRTANRVTAGSLLELYAITGAVLGGCSLRGGEGTVPGMLLGAAVLPLLRQICIFSPHIGSELEYTVIGAALLLATVGNELLLRFSARRAG